MTLQRADARIGLRIAGQTDFNGNSLAGNVLGQQPAVLAPVANGGILNQLVRKQPGAVTDPIRITIRDRLKNGFGTVGLAGMDGFL